MPNKWVWTGYNGGCPYKTSRFGFGFYELASYDFRLIAQTICPIIAAMSLKIAPVNSTALKITVIRENPNAANFYIINHQGHSGPWQCKIHKTLGNQFCLFSGLEPATKYNFEVHARTYANGFDITSEKKYFSGQTLGNCMFSYSFMCEFIYRVLQTSHIKKPLMSLIEDQAVSNKANSL